MPESNNISTTSALAFHVPAGAVGFHVQNETDTPIRIRISAVAGTSGATLGMLLPAAIGGIPSERFYSFGEALKTPLDVHAIHAGVGTKTLTWDAVFGSPGAVGISNPTSMAGVTLQASDIEIGAVEIKNGTSDDRAVVDSSGNLSSKDAGPSWTTVRGLTNGAPFASSDQSASAAAVTNAPTSGQKLIIDDLIVSVDTAMVVTFTEETSGYVVHKFYMAANTSIQVTTRAKTKLVTADNKLMVQTSAAGNIAVAALYHSEA